MDTFLKFNREKLKSIFIRLSLICLGFVFIVLTIPYLTGHFPSGQLLISILLVAGVGFPFFILLLGYLTWLLSHNARQKAFSKIPFNQIETIGFHGAYLDEKSKWSFTDEIRKGQLGGFTLTMDISKEKAHTFEFDILTEWKRLDKNEYKRLTEIFKQHNVEFRIGSLVKQYNLRQPIVATVSDLKVDLELITTQLRQEGFNPKA